MDAEDMAGLRRRASIHAALSDLARLRIVDLLNFGDLSPTELQAELEMPSNLLAHHLKVLEGQGLVIRAKSEADRRRSYVRLVPEALSDVEPGPVGSADRVVFVCTANSARSQLAAALWRRSSRIPAASAGTHPADRIDPGAVATAHRHDVRLPALRPRRISKVLTGDDFVITVCDHAHEELGALGRLHWSVPDPVRIGTDAAFDSAFGELSRRVHGLAGRLALS